jgi:hypothetical protein
MPVTAPMMMRMTPRMINFSPWWCSDQALGTASYPAT